MNKAHCIAVCLCAFVKISNPFADTLTVTDINDTYIVMNKDSTPDHLPTLIVEGYDCGACIDQRALLQINLGAFDKTVKIDNAELQLYSPSQPRPGSGVVRVYKMTKRWIPAEANWNNASAAVRWSSSGADFKPTPSATLKYGSQVNVWHTYDVTALTQDLVANPDSNFGIMLMMDPMMLTVAYASSNAPSADLRPKLKITFSPTSADIGSRRLNQPAGTLPIYRISSSQLQISFANDQTHAIWFGMLNGRMLFNRETAGSGYTIPLSGITPGFYTIRTSGIEGTHGRTLFIGK